MDLIFKVTTRRSEALHERWQIYHVVARAADEAITKARKSFDKGEMATDVEYVGPLHHG